MKRFLAIALCVLMLAALTACQPTPSHNHNHDHDVPPVGDANLNPVAQDATGSVFLGTWNVTSQNSVMDKITYSQNGSLQVYFDSYQLGGVFFDDGAKITMYISQKVIEGTYVHKDGVITIVTADDTLILTKA